MRTRALLLHTVLLGVAIVIGAAVYLLAPGWLHGTIRVIGGYDVAAAFLLVAYWFEIFKTDALTARTTAGPEDLGRNVLSTMVILAAGVGLYAAIQVLGRGAREMPGQQSTAYTLGFVAVVLGWLLIHTIFTFRYGRLYYGDRDLDEKPDEGLVFPGKQAPGDFDFAYFSFVVGMTFQVSDVQVTSRTIRRVVLVHGLISFAYNTTILALVVNLASNLLH